MVVTVVLAFEVSFNLLLALRDVLNADLAKINIIALGVGISSATKANVSCLALPAATSAAIAAEHMTSLVLGHVGRLHVRAKTF